MRLHRFFFALLLLFLPTQLGFHFWPDWAMVLGRRVDYLSPTIYFTDVIILLIVSFWFFEGVPKFKKSIILLGLFISINIYFSANHSVAIYKWLKVLEFVFLGWYIVRTKPSLSFITTYLSIAVLYSSLIAIVQFIVQRSISGPLWFLGERTFTIDTSGIARVIVNGRELLRAYATFPHPNVLGGFLAVTLPLLLRLKKNLPRRQAGKLFYMSFSLGVIALILTFSRSAWIVGFVAVAVMIEKNKRFFMIFALIPIIFVLTKVNPLEESIVVRQQLNAAAVKLWTTSPLFGVGLGNFLVELPKTLPSKSVYFLQPVHNIYLLILAETGIVGFLLFCWFLWKAFLHPFSIWHLSFIILLILGLIDHYPFTLQQGQLMLTLFLAITFVRQ